MAQHSPPGPHVTGPNSFSPSQRHILSLSLLTVLLRLCLSLVSLRFLALSCLVLSIFVARSLLVDRKYIPNLELLRL